MSVNNYAIKFLLLDTVTEDFWVCKNDKYKNTYNTVVLQLQMMSSPNFPWECFNWIRHITHKWFVQWSEIGIEFW